MTNRASPGYSHVYELETSASSRVRFPAGQPTAQQSRATEGRTSPRVGGAVSHPNDRRSGLQGSLKSRLPFLLWGGRLKFYPGVCGGGGEVRGQPVTASSFLLPTWSIRDQSQVLKLGSQLLYLLIHLAGCEGRGYLKPSADKDDLQPLIFPPPLGQASPHLVIFDAAD